MGSGCSVIGDSTSTEEKKIHTQQEIVNQHIEKEIIAEKRKKILKLLLLGPGDSGKSTTLKQIRIIHDQGFSEEEKIQRKYIIYLNLIAGMVSIINGLKELSMNYQIPNSEVYLVTALNIN
uniref:G-protein alpha subunit n=1 Tax=Heterorhabditis bacteriophora TaxID=37862 RepID=A0A1I7XEM8_HETBA